MKKFLLIAAAVVVIVLGFVWWVFRLTSGVYDSANAFIDALKEEDLSGAYACLSEDFQASTSPEDFRDFLENSALINVRTSTWTSRSVSGATGEVEGSVETSDGGTVHIKLSMVKEKSGWKIQSLQKPPAGIVSGDESETRPLPDDVRLRRMCDGVMSDLAAAINSQSFEAFYGNISELWRAQTSPEALLDAFQSFRDQQIDLSALQELEPVFSDKPHLNEDGWLQMEGYYPSQPSLTYFKLKYVYEHPRWKLAGVNVQVK